MYFEWFSYDTPMPNRWAKVRFLLVWYAPRVLQIVLCVTPLVIVCVLEWTFSHHIPPLHNTVKPHFLVPEYQQK